MINELLPSTEPLVPNSERRNNNKCLGCRCNLKPIPTNYSPIEHDEVNNTKVTANILQISEKLAKAVFLAPALLTCGGFMTSFFFSPVIIAGFLSRIMSNTRRSSYKHNQSCKICHNNDEYWQTLRWIGNVSSYIFVSGFSLVIQPNRLFF